MTHPQKDKGKILLEEELARALILSHWIAYATTGPDGIINVTSDNFWALQSEPSVSAIGRTLPEVLWEFIGVEHILTEILQSRRAVFQLNRIVRPTLGGEAQYINIQVVALSELNPGSGLLLIIEDITTIGQLEQSVTQERNQLLLTKTALTEANQKLTRLDKYKSAVVAMAAQDIQTALLAAYEFAERIIASPTHEDVGLHAQAILSQSHYALQLIKDLVELDQIERGVSHLKFEPCDVQALLHEVIETMRPIADTKQQGLSVEKHGQPLTILADATRLRQALFRLLSTALHVSAPETHIHCDILFQEHPTSLKNKFAVIQISSQVAGDMDEMVLPESTSILPWENSQDGGSGLMAEWFLARRLVEIQGGHAVISVKQGVVFAVYIPLQ